MKRSRGPLWLRLHGRKVLWLADGFLISAAAGIAVAFLLGQIHPLSIHASGGLVLAISYLGLLVMRLLVGLLIKQINEPVSLTWGSHSELLADLSPSTFKMIEEADVVQILAGTLIEFVRQEAALKALAHAASRGARIQVIMLDPAAEILQVIAAERSSRSDVPTEEIFKRIQSECTYSVNRLREVLPPGAVGRSLRLSSAMPHQAFTRYGDRYLLTPYTFGRGGSSPAMFFRQSGTSKPLCDGLQRGFEELWESSMVRKVGEEALSES